MQPNECFCNKYWSKEISFVHNRIHIYLYLGFLCSSKRQLYVIIQQQSNYGVLFLAISGLTDIDLCVCTCGCYI